MKNKTTHTPGPWQLGGWGDVYSPGIMPMAEAGPLPTAYKIAKVPFGGETTNVLGVSKDESRANHRLIAAAPELLAAVKAVLAWDEVNTSIAVNTEGCEVREMLRSSIAKAEGGS